MSSLAAIITPLAIQEDNREQETGDDSFYRQLAYFFELRVPQSIGVSGTTYLFPLALAPNQISMDEPFAVERTVGLRGGLRVEEEGIISRTLTISGNTGFAPKPLAATQGVITLLSPDKRSFNRDVTKEGWLAALSGQRHLQYLQDRVFRAYADLKQDPTTAADTLLIFHNQKDDEHWLVVPENFRLERSAARNNLYEYTIQLLVVGPADATTLPPSEDASLLDELKNAVSTIKRYAQLAQAAIEDIVAAVNEVRQFVKSIDNIIDSVGQIINAATDFINGVTAVVDLPYQFVQSALALVDDANSTINAASELADTVTQLPDNLAHSFAQLGDAIEGLGSQPGSYQTTEDQQVANAIQLQQLATNVSATDIAQVLTSPPTTLDAFRGLGTGLMPGDPLRANIADNLGATPPVFRSVTQYTIRQGDSLPMLAARLLGDAGLWPQIALTNNLKPPFISQYGLPNTVRVGSMVLIPSTAAPPEQQPAYATLGVTEDESQEVRLLGCDFALTRDAQGRFDMVVDTEGGSQDALLVRGISNLQQALTVRTIEEQGFDPLYQNLGVKRIMGTRNTFVDLKQARFRLIESLTDDPRIAGINSLRFTTPTPDRVDAQITAEVRGYTQPVTLKASVS